MNAIICTSNLLSRLGLAPYRKGLINQGTFDRATAKAKDSLDPKSAAAAAPNVEAPELFKAGCAEAARLSAVPEAGTHHPTDYSAVVTGIEAQPHENSDVMFLVQVEYTTTTFGLPVNPLDYPPEISYGDTDATEPYFKDHSTPNPKRTVSCRPSRG